MTDKKKLVLRMLVEYGSIRKACERSLLCRSTYYWWCSTDKEFRDQAAACLIEGKK